MMEVIRRQAHTGWEINDHSIQACKANGKEKSMRFPSRETVERIRRMYPAGTRVRLVMMDDPQAPPAGTEGTVQGVDDTGSLLMRWDNGSCLNVVYDEDEVRKI